MSEPSEGSTPPVKIQILTQYTRDLSFENVVAQKGIQATEVQPEIQVQVSLDAQKRPRDNQYEVVQKYRVSSVNKVSGESLFILEVEYGGVFLIEGVPAEQLHAYLLIECPRLLFPFVRRIVSDVTRDGGFPQLNLEMVDFMGLYRQELARRAAATPAGTA
jgi:preprotein translocase subunit SecB